MPATCAMMPGWRPRCARCPLPWRATCGDEQLVGKTVKLKLRWPDFTTLTRQVTLSAATDREEDIFPAALGLLKKVRGPGRAVRLIGVGVSGLSEPARQLGLWEMDAEKSRKLQAAVDVLHEKYGRKIIQRGGDPEVTT